MYSGEDEPHSQYELLLMFNALGADKKTESIGVNNDWKEWYLLTLRVPNVLRDEPYNLNNYLRIEEEVLNEFLALVSHLIKKQDARIVKGWCHLVLPLLRRKIPHEKDL